MVQEQCKAPASPAPTTTPESPELAFDYGSNAAQQDAILGAEQVGLAPGMEPLPWWDQGPALTLEALWLISPPRALERASEQRDDPSVLSWLRSLDVRSTAVEVLTERSTLLDTIWPIGVGVESSRHLSGALALGAKLDATSRVLRSGPLAVDFESSAKAALSLEAGGGVLIKDALGQQVLGAAAKAGIHFEAQAVWRESTDLIDAIQSTPARLDWASLLRPGALIDAIVQVPISLVEAPSEVEITGLAKGEAGAAAHENLPPNVAVPGMSQALSALLDSLDGLAALSAGVQLHFEPSATGYHFQASGSASAVGKLVSGFAGVDIDLQGSAAQEVTFGVDVDVLSSTPGPHLDTAWIESKTTVQGDAGATVEARRMPLSSLTQGGVADMVGTRSDWLDGLDMSIRRTVALDLPSGAMDEHLPSWLPVHAAAAMDGGAGLVATDASMQLKGTMELSSEELARLSPPSAPPYRTAREAFEQIAWSVLNRRFLGTPPEPWLAPYLDDLDRLAAPLTLKEATVEGGLTLAAGGSASITGGGNASLGARSAVKLVVDRPLAPTEVAELEARLKSG